MKTFILTSLLGVSLLAFTGCTDTKDATVAKCQSGKCDTGKKINKKCGTATKMDKKCGTAKKSSKCGG